MSEYNTKQKSEIVAFFRSHRDSSYTSEEVLLNMPDVSRATLYRLIARLSEEGLLVKLARSGRSAAYQYIDPEECVGHMHMTCILCGKTFHIGKELSESLRAMLERGSGYRVLNSSMLRGICPECQEGA